MVGVQDSFNCRDLRHNILQTWVSGQSFLRLRRQFPGALFDGELTGDESDLLAKLLQEPQSLADGQKAMGDYIEIIRAEAAKRRSPELDPVADLLATQAKGKQKLEREDTK